jgi:hypothetical protein
VASTTGSEKERAFSNGRNVVQSNRKKPKPVPKPDIRTVTLKHKTKQLQRKRTDVINHEYILNLQILYGWFPLSEYVFKVCGEKFRRVKIFQRNRLTNKMQ